MPSGRQGWNLAILFSHSTMLAFQTQLSKGYEDVLLLFSKLLLSIYPKPELPITLPLSSAWPVPSSPGFNISSWARPPRWALPQPPSPCLLTQYLSPDSCLVFIPTSNYLMCIFVYLWLAFPNWKFHEGRKPAQTFWWHLRWGRWCH